MSRVTLPAALLCLLLSFTALAETNWKVLEPDGGRFSIVLPGPTEYSTSQAETFLGPIVAHSFYVSDPQATCTIVYTDLPPGALVLAGKNRIYKEARDEVLRRTEARLVSYENTGNNSRSGRILTYSGAGKTGRTEMFLVRNRLYVVDVFYASTAKSEASAKIFDSLKLIDSVAAR